MKRRRVDVSLRLEEAKAAAQAIEDTLRSMNEVGDADPSSIAYGSRLRRAFAKLQRGVAYVTGGAQ